jgi:hypothetical protein
MTELAFDTLQAIMDALPANINFVDENDIVRYCNRADKRTFVVSEGMGNKVQDCHSEAVRSQVTEILNDLKSGKAEISYVTVNSKGRKKSKRYYPVKDKSGKYIGAVELVEDITDL